MSQNKVLNDLLSEKKLILITGKGGIGKTLMACALARRAEKMGRRVLVVEQSAVEQVGPLLGFHAVSHEETWNGNLGAANFTAGGNFRDFVTKHLMKSSLLDFVVSNKVVHSFFTAIPGFAELMLLGRVFYAMNLAPSKRPDLIIMDSYASGHFMSLMTTPDAVLKSGLAGPIMQQTTMVRNWLADKEQCATIYVAVPEDLVVSEALDFLPVLSKKSPVALGAVIMNRCLPAPGGEARDGVSMSSFVGGRRVRQDAAMKTFNHVRSGNEALRNIPVIEIPEVGAIDEPLSSDSVDALFGGVR